MIKKKYIYIIFLLIEFVLVILLKRESYYHGLGDGFFNKKIPKEYYLMNGDFFKENKNYNIDFVNIMDKDMNLFLISEGKKIELSNNESFYIKNFLGYYFNNKKIVAKLQNDRFETYFILISKELDFKKVNFTDVQKLTYVDLKSNYFRYLIFINLISILITIFLMIKLFSYFLNFILSKIIKWH